jgi:hypothetical protein
MLEALALDAPQRGSLTDEEWDALAVGMLEAVGMVRDTRSRPVLAAIFEAKHARPAVVAAAARALGRLGGDPELAVLTKHAKKGDALELHAVHGLGEMRRLESAKHLAGVLASTKDPAVSEAAATALGILGSSWAWRALGQKHAATGLEVRKVCAKALAPLFPKSRAALRTAVGDAILMVEHPETVALLKAVRPAAGDDAKAVDHLIGRVERAQRRKIR